MARTRTKLKDILKPTYVKPWQAHKLAKHKHLRHAMGHSEVGTKLTPGPGGINCGCCTRFTPEVLKIKSRRVERRRAHIMDHVTAQEQLDI
jgi:hypothetical protein